MLKLKQLASIDQDLEHVLNHDFLYGTTDASHHTIYHYGDNERQANLFVPTFGCETEPFGWNYEGYEELSETPLWFESRFRIGKALWDVAIMDSMNYFIAKEVTNELAKEEAFSNDPTLIKKFVKEQLENSMYYEQMRYAKKDIEKIFEQHNEALPCFIFWKDDEIYGVYSLSPSEYKPFAFSKAVSDDILTHLNQENRSFILRHEQLSIAIN